MENKVRVWLARDKDGDLYVYPNIPLKNERIWSQSPINSMELESYNFPSVRWEDDNPTEAYIALTRTQEQPKQEQPTPKQEIDWEQRRYELVKEMMIELHRRGVVEWDELADGAVGLTDMLIEKLKKGGEK